MSDHFDPYAILGLSPDASQRAIRAAYRALARRYHPDLNGLDPEAERAFKRIARAYEILGNPARRARHDRSRALGRFGRPGAAQLGSFRVEGELYHSDLGHHSDFYGPGDPIGVAEAAHLVGCHPATLRRRIRRGQLGAIFDGRCYWLRRRDVERLLLARRGGPAPSHGKVRGSAPVDAPSAC